MQRAPATAEIVTTTVEEPLAAARATLLRLAPVDAHAAMRDGEPLVDIRSESQRAAGGTIPGAAFVLRNPLDWRLTRRARKCDERLAAGHRFLVLICNEGYRSSLAAATVQRFGQRPVADVIGGFQAWCAAGLPVEPSTGPRGT